MRWLFGGIAAMALGLVLLGTLSGGGEAKSDEIVPPQDRFVEFVIEGQGAPGSKRRPPMMAPHMGKKTLESTGEPAPADGEVNAYGGARARGEEGYFGKDDKPGRLAPKAPPADDFKYKDAERERAPEIALEEEEDEVAYDGDDEVDAPSAPPPPPAARPKPAPVIKAITGDASATKAFDKASKSRAVAEKTALKLVLDDPSLDAGEARPQTRNSRDSDVRSSLRADLDLSNALLPARLDLSLLGEPSAQSVVQEAPPERFLPRMCYFENTYLGGNAAWQEQLRRVRTALGQLGPLQHARLDTQAFDPPPDAGMALTASLDRAGLQQPGRVVLQVGLQGSQRFGWRRPPLDMVLVVDGPATDLTQRAAKALLARLSPRDRLGVIESGSATPIAAVADLRTTRDLLIDIEARAPGGTPADLVVAMDRASAMLTQAARDAARIPGSQTVVVLTRDGGAHAQAARAAAHRLQTQGAVVSVVDLGAADDAGWWAVANAGHGNFHRATTDTLGDAFDAELATLSKVVARLLRLNVRLGPHTEGVRVIGSRILGQQEVKEVKAREVATDRNLSKTMGVKANRGEDDDGIQTVIPYFYGGDSHVVLIELWVDPAKGSLDSAIAEISLKYKDMVNLSNATARAAVFLARRPKRDTRAQQLVKRNLEGFAFAEALERAAQQAGQGNWSAVRQTLRNHAHRPHDRRVAQAFEALIGQQSPARMQQALTLASRQRKGTSNGVDP